MHRRLATALSTALALAACATSPSQRPAGDATSCPNTLPVVTVHRVRGVVLPSAVARRDLSLRRKDVESYWVPSEDDVNDVETSLHDAVKARLAEATWEPASPSRDSDVAALTHILSHYDAYLRQYAGIVVNGGRRVLVNALPDDTYCYRDSLVTVGDGGPWFWTIQYDVTLRQFLHWELTGRP